MIYNKWYIILESKELKKLKPLRITRFDEQLSLWRDENGSVCCIADKCCHRGGLFPAGK
jgi:phenylpropionate dioxygenase-like ring-hydroxylating dioxygenase large terminal subunit